MLFERVGDRDRFPLSPKVKSLKAILAKLAPPAPRPEPLPPPAQPDAGKKAAAVGHDRHPDRLCEREHPAVRSDRAGRAGLRGGLRAPGDIVTM
jgi:hypothetical protein